MVKDIYINSVFLFVYGGDFLGFLSFSELTDRVHGFLFP